MGLIVRGSLSFPVENWGLVSDGARQSWHPMDVYGRICLDFVVEALYLVQLFVASCLYNLSCEWLHHMDFGSRHCTVWDLQ
eukprot:6257048-Amphidinium_carterae.1